MYPSSLSLCSTLLVLATGASAAMGTMCRNQDPNQSCGAAAVATVSPPCEAYSDQSVKTSCICSTLSKIASCYESLCPRDNLNDVYDSKFNSMSCPNAPPLTQGLGYTTATATAANTGGAAVGGTPTSTTVGAVNTGADSNGGGIGKSGAAAGRVLATGRDLLFAAVGAVLGGVVLLGAAL